MGHARELEPRIHAALRHGQVEAKVLETREPGHAEQLAAAAADLGHDRVVAVGGDGTVQEVVNGLMSGRTSGVPPPMLGVVPAGSGNDLARSLGLPLAPLDALTVALGAQTRPLDLGVARTGDRVRYFHAAGGTGFDAQVAYTMASRRRGWQRGRAGYFLSTLNELRRYRNRELRIRLATSDGARELDGRFLFVAFANGPYYGGGMQICPDASNRDGMLDVCLVGDISRLGALRELPGIYRAAHVNHPLVELVRVLELRIEGQAETRVHLDGEPLGTLPVDVGVRPAALQVAAVG
jgi:diacylglycerol kinase (ATP)